MARILVRVELHGPTTPQHYERLDAQMAAAGFSRTVISGNASEYWLPNATYSSERYRTEGAARDVAWVAANGVARSYAVIATCGTSAWRGLFEAQTAA